MKTKIHKPFQLGTLMATPGALRALQESRQSPDTFLVRHAQGDWGEVCDEDWELNNQAVAKDERLLSIYTMDSGEQLWLITEWDRKTTTCLLAGEY